MSLVQEARFQGTVNHWGLFWLIAATAAAGVFFIDGVDALLTAWQLPEYSHGPLIPVLSGLLFLRQLKDYPADPGPKHDRWVGVCVLLLAITLGALGKLSNISDIVAYATILWVGAMLLISFGWQTGRHFWPGVLHLVYMLPLPGVLYYKLSTSLQLVSSEIGVYFLQLLGVPVFLEGNIIDLGVLKLHVAEACSGLRYLFPILSFSYIFAVLYRGPMWHKAILLLAAVPITVLMNSVRIAVAGIIVQEYGVEWLDGFTHFFEGWVIFLICVVLLFLLAWVLLLFHPDRPGLISALDLDTEGLVPQMARLRLVRPSAALISATLVTVAVSAAWHVMPQRDTLHAERESFLLFPRSLGDWRQLGVPEVLTADVVQSLGADEYHSVNFAHPDRTAPVGFFSAWYEDQSKGGVHSPEICLPGGGWEIAWLERVDVSGRLGMEGPFNVNRAVIQKGQARMLVYYWFDQKGRKIAWDFAAKFYLLWDGIVTGRTDGALVRLTTRIDRDETEAQAAARLDDIMREVVTTTPRFIPGF